MRILLVSAHGADTTYGGAERYVADLAIGLRARGHEPAILSAFPTRETPAGIEQLVLHDSDWRTSELRRLRNHGGDVLALPSKRAARLVDELAPDLVHTNNLPGFSTGIWATAAARSLPVVHTLHDYFLLCPRTTLRRRDGAPCRPHPLLCGLRTRRLRRFDGAVTHVIAGSEHLLRVHRSFFANATTTLVRLPLVPLTTAAPTPAAKLRSVGYIGGLASFKGVAALLEAAPSLRRNGIELRIAGDGQLRAAVEAAASRGDLTYDGFVGGTGKAAFLEACDAGIVPSEWDEPSGPPYVVCEWLASGRPVLASARGGLAEVPSSLGGVVAIEPSVDGIVAGVERLRQPNTWGEAVSALPTARPADRDRWLDEHEAVYADAA